MGKKAIELIHNLLDEGSFVEIGARVVAKNHISDKACENDGVITGYGTINCKPLYVYAQDDTVLDASIGEAHAKKIVALYKKAIEMGSPIIGFIANSGIRIDEGYNSLLSFGKILSMQAQAKNIIPQISIVVGKAFGGSAILANGADFVLMEENNAKMFTFAPNAVAENKSYDIANAENLAADNIIDFYGSEKEIIQKAQELINILPSNFEDNDSYEDCTDDLNRLTPNVSSKNGFELVKTISDNNYVLPLKEKAGKAISIGFAKFNGQTVGYVSNTSDKFVVGYSSIMKAVKFINFLSAFNIPVLTIADVKMFNAACCKKSELGIAASKLILAYIECESPKVTLVKNAYSFAGFMMGSKALNADIVYAFNNSSMSVMDEQRAVELLYKNEIEKEKDKNEFIKMKTEEYKNNFSSAYAAAACDYVDDIIDDEKTRQLVISSFEMLFTKNV